MKNSECLPFKVAVDDIIPQVMNNWHLFNDCTLRQNYDGSAHRDTKTIFIRWSKENTSTAVFNTTSAIDYPASYKLNLVRDFVDDVATELNTFNLGRILIVSLRPGGKIIPHVDEGLYADSFERFHIPLQEEGKSPFFVASPDGSVETVNMKKGHVYWFNHKARHWAENNGTQDRIHLIMDCSVTKYHRERQ